MPRGTRIQRRILTLALIVAVGMLTLPFSAAVGAERATTPHAAAGEPGSGPPRAPDRISAATLGRLNSVKWSDVPAGYWARNAIDYVGSAKAWMRDFPKNGNGTYDFKPDRLESRKLFARALVKAFAPTVDVDPKITFDDLPSDAPFYPWANIAVQKGWLRRTGGGTKFSPDQPVTTRTVHQGLVLALGLRSAAAGLDRLHTANGIKFATPPKFGTLLIGMRLGLRYNHSDESLDVGPDTPLPRSEVAWSLYQAKTAASYEIESMEPYASIELPSLGPKLQSVVQWGVKYVGYPYVWGGEWNKRSPGGYGFGFQPVGGFDCSGLTWWNLKAAGGGWDNRPPRPYAGWSLAQRTSADMARYGNVRFRHLEPGDLMLYDGDGDHTVDHVDTFIGNGWSLDSGGSNAGVTITYTGTGSWYQDHFVHGRRVIK
jgi:cell wall-associated NlpC family hydrolase